MGQRYQRGDRREGQREDEFKWSPNNANVWCYCNCNSHHNKIKLCFISTSSCLPFSSVPQSIRPQTNDRTSLRSFGSPAHRKEAERQLLLNLLQPILRLRIVSGVRYCSLSCKLLPLAQQWHIHVARASCTAYKCPEKERSTFFSSTEEDAIVEAIL